MKIKIILAIALLIMTAACTNNQNIPLKPHLDDSGASFDDVDDVVLANNQFAFDYYNQVNADDENMFFSPYSISTALAMTYEGARGQTAEEIKEVFHYPEIDKLRKGSASIYNSLNSAGKEVQLSTANALWAEQTYEFLQEYFDTIDSQYGGKVTNMDFRNEPEPSRTIINDWVEAQTMNRIKDLIPQGLIDSSTRLVLTNAIYFKGSWQTEFDVDMTREKEFWKTPQDSVLVDMMHLNGKDFNYAENKDIQILEMPYEGEEYSMLLLLPKAQNEQDRQKHIFDIKNAGTYMDSAKLDELKSQMVKQEVNVQIPKFTFETKYYMAQDLTDMGMPTAFGGGADFSGMTGNKDLIISQVIHQAFVEVNEEGTEAAAATAVIVAEKAAIIPTNSFIADHPFIFIIQHKETGNILFMGKVVEPKT